ncbi:hypothetical protein ABW20_dc0107274 [Dactylellina cionopaga]|nr:hypothetical protein ABW20_dc0107274 [Dactylellina cionopaga]
MAESTRNMLKLIVSVRDSIDILSELEDAINTGETDSPEVLELYGIRLINITSEKNSNDLREYLTHDVGEVLTRRIIREEYTSYYDSELRRIVNIIHGKAKGDFTLARMIIANLQQPSKDSLDKRIKQLPTAIGDIYMSSLESLTPDEQELIVTTLKWVVWTVSGVTILEITDHYREFYRTTVGNGVDEENETHAKEAEKPHAEGSNQDLEGVVSKPIYTNPYDDPEIKDVIYHVENAGRDFFKFNRNTGLVSVDISVREWVQEDNPGSKSAIKDSRGFSKYRDFKGNTVYRFTLTPSFVRYGDSLSELFNEKEAQISIAINILRALNHEHFQTKYMSWKPEWVPSQPKQQRRYEIDHWQDHIRILQKWWTDGSLEDSWWSELLTQLSIFTKPENWSLWNLQREFLSPQKDGESAEIAWKDEYFNRVFEEPIHLACIFGIPLMVDLLVRDVEMSRDANAKPLRSGSPQSDRMKMLKTARAEALIQKYSINKKLLRDLDTFLPGMDRDQLTGMLDSKVKKEMHQSKLKFGLRAKYHVLNVVELQKELEKQPVNAWIESLQPLCDNVTPNGQMPLRLAAGSPQTVKQLIKYGADINQKHEYPNFDGEIGGMITCTPLLSIIQGVLEIVRRNADDNSILPLLQSAKTLISEGADLSIRDYSQATILHLAAGARNLKFFKKLCVSGDWDVHARDIHDMTPLHYLFLDPPPRDTEKVQEVLSICRLIVKMKRSDKDEDLVNAEDDSSMNALAYAVMACFKQGVELLIELGTDIYDRDRNGANCFHHLADSNGECGDRSGREITKVFSDPVIDLEIADILLKAKLNIAQEDDFGRTPLFYAIVNRNWHLVSYFLAEYAKLGPKLQDENGDSKENPLLYRSKQGSTIFHAIATVELDENEREGFSELFYEITTILAEYTDIREFLSARVCLNSRDTAIHSAVAQFKSTPRRTQNFELIKSIVAICPEALQFRDLNLNSVFDIAGEQIGVDFGSSVQTEQETQLSIDIFNYLFPKVTDSELSFSLFTKNLLKATNELKPRFDIHKVIWRYDVPFKDRYGWGLYDYLAINGTLEYLAPYIMQNAPSPLEDFPRPSKIMFQPGTKAPEQTLSEDGLTCSVDGN